MVDAQAFECPVAVGLHRGCRQPQVGRDALVSPALEHPLAHVALPAGEQAERQIERRRRAGKRQMPLDARQQRPRQAPDRVDGVVRKRGLRVVPVEIDRQQSVLVVSGNDRKPLAKTVPAVDPLALRRRDFARVPVRQHRFAAGDGRSRGRERFVPAIQRRAIGAPGRLGAVRHAEAARGMQRGRRIVEKAIDRPPAERHPAVELRQRAAAERRIADRCDDARQRFLGRAVVAWRRRANRPDRDQLHLHIPGQSDGLHIDDDRQYCMFSLSFIRWLEHREIPLTLDRNMAQKTDMSGYAGFTRHSRTSRCRAWNRAVDAEARRP